MQWFEASVFERAETGKDVLGHPTTELADAGRTVLVRVAPWSAARDSEDGNWFDSIERTFLTKAAPSLLEGCAALSVNGALYEVEGINGDARTTAIKAKRVKP